MLHFKVEGDVVAVTYNSVPGTPLVFRTPGYSESPKECTRVNHVFGLILGIFMEQKL